MDEYARIGDSSCSFHEYWDHREMRTDNYGHLTAKNTAADIQRPASSSLPVNAIMARLRGPGGYYNAGNLLALVAGVTAQVLSAAAEGDMSASSVLWGYFFGNPGASWLTFAVVVFLISGEVYHRAWSARIAPDIRLNRYGDLLSGIGASALTMSMIAYGNVFLALASGVILAGGKFGNALFQDGDADGATWIARACRWAALVSRGPALAALALDLVLSLGSGHGAVGPALMTSIMIGCTLIWSRADYLLLRGS